MTLDHLAIAACRERFALEESVAAMSAVAPHAVAAAMAGAGIDAGDFAHAESRRIVQAAVDLPTATRERLLHRVLWAAKREGRYVDAVAVSRICHQFDGPKPEMFARLALPMVCRELARTLHLLSVGGELLRVAQKTLGYAAKEAA